jgi:hypothetical protein
MGILRGAAQSKNDEQSKETYLMKKQKGGRKEKGTHVFRLNFLLLLQQLQLF